MVIAGDGEGWMRRLLIINDSIITMSATMRYLNTFL
jgi:hypothetical protein